MKLHQLSNGNWIDLSTITGLSALARTQAYDNGPIIPARMVVHAGSQTQVCVCDDMEQATQMSNDLAAKVNANNLKPETCSPAIALAAEGNV